MPRRSSKKKPVAEQPPVTPAAEEPVAEQPVAEQPVAEPAEPSPETPAVPPGGKNLAAVALGRLGGQKGGLARAKKLTKKQRSEIAKKAAQARWKKKQD